MKCLVTIWITFTMIVWNNERIVHPDVNLYRSAPRFIKSEYLRLRVAIIKTTYEYIQTNNELKQIKRWKMCENEKLIAKCSCTKVSRFQHVILTTYSVPWFISNIGSFPSQTRGRTSAKCCLTLTHRYLHIRKAEIWHISRDGQLHQVFHITVIFVEFWFLNKW